VSGVEVLLSVSETLDLHVVILTYVKAQILSKVIELVIDLFLNIVDDVVEKADNTV
jgi:hypothetical protein